MPDPVHRVMTARVISVLTAGWLGAAEVLQNGFACPGGQNSPYGTTDLTNECRCVVRLREHRGHQKHRGKHGKDRGESRSLGHGEGVVLEGTPQCDPKV